MFYWFKRLISLHLIVKTFFFLSIIVYTVSIKLHSLFKEFLYFFFKLSFLFCTKWNKNLCFLLKRSLMKSSNWLNYLQWNVYKIEKKKFNDKQIEEFLRLIIVMQSLWIKSLLIHSHQTMLCFVHILVRRTFLTDWNYTNNKITR